MKKPIRTVLETVLEGINQGLTNGEILVNVRAAYPNSSLTLATINYHRNQARKMNPEIKTEFELARSRGK